MANVRITWDVGVPSGAESAPTATKLEISTDGGANWTDIPGAENLPIGTVSFDAGGLAPGLTEFGVSHLDVNGDSSPGRVVFPMTVAEILPPSPTNVFVQNI